MPLRFKRIERVGPVPREYAVLHISRCEHCVLWEPSRYGVIGACRRYPYPRMYLWQKCAAWINRWRHRDVFAEAFEKPLRRRPRHAKKPG